MSEEKKEVNKEEVQPKRTRTKRVVKKLTLQIVNGTNAVKSKLPEGYEGLPDPNVETKKTKVEYYNSKFAKLNTYIKDWDDDEKNEKAKEMLIEFSKIEGTKEKSAGEMQQDEAFSLLEKLKDLYKKSSSGSSKRLKKDAKVEIEF